MQIKRRDMMLSNIYKGYKNYYSKEKEIGKATGVVSIIKFNEVDKPLEVHYNFKDATIVDSNYTWVQVAIKDSNFWIKAMYDENDKLIEIYIDVTNGNYFDDINNPEYEDLFLDIIIPSKGHIYQMDDVELMKAYRDNTISEEEFKLSKIVCRNLIKYLENNLKDFLDFINNLKKELEKDLDKKGKLI